ncbi:MAG: alpha/beta hydrolase [Lautropia sp.]|nr:alpha/beta hydrolase [Lautropia sp.]
MMDTEKNGTLPVPPAAGRRPLLILLHGTRMNAAQWTGFDTALADLADVIALDLPGHGARSGEAFSLDAVVQDVERLLADAGTRPVMLAGYSLGGYAALCFAEKHPQKLAGLALIASAAEPFAAGAWLYRLLGSTWDFLVRHRIDWLERHWFARLADPALWAAIQAHGGNFGQIRAAWDEVIARCRAAQLRAVSCPVLVAGGSRDQLHLHAQRFAAAAPCGKVVTVPGRSHLWPLTHPHELKAVLRDWIGQDVIPTGGASDETAGTADRHGGAAT